MIELPASVVLASPLRRVLGRLIDQLIVVGPVALVAVSTGIDTVDDLGDSAVAINVAVVTVTFVYEFVMVASLGRTVGKFAVGTRAVRVDNGGPVPWSSSAIRALVPVAAAVIPGIGQVLSLLVYSNVFFDRARRGWHDRAAGTIVVMARG